MSGRRVLWFFVVGFTFMLLVQMLRTPEALAAETGQTRRAWAFDGSPGQDCNVHLTLDCLDVTGDLPAQSGQVQNPVAPGFTLLFFTPLDVTANNTQIINIQNASLIIVNDFVVAALVLSGLNVIITGTVFRYAQIVESAPGILLGLIAANCSMIFIHFFIGLNDVLCVAIYTWAANVQNVPDQGLVSILQITPTNLNFDNYGLVDIISSFANVMPLIKDVLSAMLLGQIVIRLFFAVLYIFLAAPCLGCWGLPNKAGQSLTRLWLSGFISTVMAQFVQVVAIIIVEFTLGPLLVSFTAQIGGNVIAPGLLNDIVHIAFLWFIIQVPGILGTASARSIVEIGGAIREAAGAIIGAQLALQQIAGQGFVSVSSLGTGLGARSLRDRLKKRNRGVTITIVNNRNTRKNLTGGKGGPGVPPGLNQQTQPGSLATVGKQAGAAKQIGGSTTAQGKGVVATGQKQKARGRGQTAADGLSAAGQQGLTFVQQIQQEADREFIGSGDE